MEVGLHIIVSQPYANAYLRQTFTSAMSFFVSRPTWINSQSSNYTKDAVHLRQNQLFVLTVNPLILVFHRASFLRSGLEKPRRNSPPQNPIYCLVISERHTDP